jgi:hypothetical protein
MEAPLLKNTDELFSYCKSDSPNAIPYTGKPLFLLIFSPTSQDSVRFLETFNKLYFYFVDYYGGSHQILIFGINGP